MIGWPSHGARLDLENDLAETHKVDSTVAAQRPSFVIDATGLLTFERDLPRSVGGADDGEGSWVLRGGRRKHAREDATGMPSRISVKLG